MFAWVGDDMMTKVMFLNVTGYQSAFLLVSSETMYVKRRTAQPPRRAVHRCRRGVIVRSSAQRCTGSSAQFTISCSLGRRRALLRPKDAQLSTPQCAAARQFYHGEAAKRVSSASLFLATVDVSVKLKEAP